MLGTPFSCFSMGAETDCSTLVAVAPGKDAEIETAGGVMSGYWSIGSEMTEIVPTRTMTIEMIDAKIGRSTQNREITLASLPVLVRPAVPAQLLQVQRCSLPG